MLRAQEQFCEDLRRLQHRSKCTDAALFEIIRTFEKYAKCPLPKSFKKWDAKMQKAAGVTYFELHGCVGCTFVFLPSDERQHCPLCRKPRLDETRRPFQVSLFVLWYATMC